MNPEDLDKILFSEKRVEPSASFAEDTMACIRAGALRPRPMSFRWICFAALMLAFALAAAWIFPSESAVREMHTLSYSIGRWILSPADTALGNSLFYAIHSLIGTLIIIWLSFRLAPGAPGR